MRILYIVLVMAFMLFSFGCDDNTSTSSSDNRDEQLRQAMRERDDAIAREQKASQERDDAIAREQKASQERDEAILERDKAQAEAKSRYVTLSVIAYGALGVGIVLIVGCFFLFRSSPKHLPSSVQDDLHCPRCGWEHAPGETVCKNCKTHF